jgi:hypothetical protein
MWPSFPNRETAAAVSRNATKWYIFGAVLSGALGLISLFSGKEIASSPTDSRIAASSASLIGAALLGLIAFKIRSMSMGWSIAGLLFGVFVVVFSLADGTMNPIGLVFEFVVLVKLFNAVRAARAWHSFDQNNDNGLAPGNLPIEPR